uniref:Histamine N-methyltransferase n=1 Tax=Mola mola TaxID=94237 RepID=A0A3Q4ARX5_MOLML
MDTLKTCYENETVEGLQFYLEHTNEHSAILQCVQDVLTGEFQRFKKRVQHCSLSNYTKFTIPFTWHIMKSEDYMKQVQAKGNMKKFDFIHMIQMIYYVDNLTNTIKFYHSLLKDNGRLMIIVEMSNSGWTTLWNTYKEELVDNVKDYNSEMVTASLKSLGLKYEEHVITNSFDITECFNPSSQTGKRVLNFLTERENFYESFTPDIRADMLDLLRNKCSIEKDGKIVFNSNLSCLLVHA